MYGKVAWTLVRLAEFTNVKKIGVISDTHIPIRAESVPEEVYEIFKDVDLILHAGDVVDAKVIKELEKIAPVVAVKGNMDQFELAEKVIVNINNKFKIGVMHGYGARDNLVNTVKNEFKDVDCIVFGHSHSAFNEVQDNVLMFNPGSACDTVFTQINSVGILHVNEKIRGEIHKLGGEK